MYSAGTGFFVWRARLESLFEAMARTEEPDNEDARKRIVDNLKIRFTAGSKEWVALTLEEMRKLGVPIDWARKTNQPEAFDHVK